MTQRWSSTTTLAAGLLLFGIVEALRPARRSTAASDGRFAVNIVLAAANFLLLPAIIPSGRSIAESLSLPSLGIAATLQNAPVVQLIAGLLLIDLLRYAVHRAFHVVPWLWRVHAVHHSDLEIDVTTGHRHHPIEYAVAGAFFGVAHVVLDVPTSALALYATVYYLWTPFTHANLALPDAVDRALRPVFVTPAFHAVHHLNNVLDGHSNFGTVLSVWDRLFGTARQPSAGVSDFGLIGEIERRPRGLLDLMLLPIVATPATASENAKGGG